jgi:hypothetical protein
MRKEEEEGSSFGAVKKRISSLLKKRNQMGDPNKNKIKEGATVHSSSTDMAGY